MRLFAKWPRCGRGDALAALEAADTVHAEPAKRERGEILLRAFEKLVKTDRRARG